jgi:hypothetical protein
MSIQTHFDKFHDKIKLSRQDDVYKKARERDDSITDTVKASFKDADYPVTADFIQGSLATSTAIVPISGDYDIDRALVIDAETAPSNPVEPKKNVLGVLENRGFKNAKIKKPCVTADYASENVHIDFPIYKISGDQHFLAIGKKNSDENNREWSPADPRGLIDWVNDSSVHADSASKKHQQFRRLVRYLKRWRDHQFSENVARKIYSIGLTVMVREQFRASLDDEGFRQDLIALRQTVERILNDVYFTLVSQDQYRVHVTLPVQPWRDIFDGGSVDTGTQFRNKLETLKTKLEEVEGLDDERKQCVILNKLFGDDFAVPNPPSRSSKTNKAVYPTAGAVGTSQGA